MDQTPISDLVVQAMDLLVPGELRPVSRLQRAFKLGYNKALRLHELAKPRTDAMNVNYRLALGEAWSAAMAIYKQGYVNSECTLHCNGWSSVLASFAWRSERWNRLRVQRDGLDGECSTRLSI